MALKCADICNPCRPWELSKQWSEKVTEEFFHQGTSLHVHSNMAVKCFPDSDHVTPFFPLSSGDIEKKHKLEVSPLCDSDTNSIADVQIGKNVHGHTGSICCKVFYANRSFPQTSETIFESQTRR